MRNRGNTNLMAVVVFAAVLLISSLTSAQTTLTYWKAPHSDVAKEIWESLLEEFERQHPGVEVEHLVTPWSGWDEKYTAAYAGGNPPDVAYMPDEFYPKFAQAGQIIPLDDFIARSPDFRSPFFPGNWQAGNFLGHQYGIPLLQINLLHYYNKGLFDQSGLTFPDAWEEIVTAAKKLTNPSQQQFGHGFTANVENPNTVYPFFWQAGADLLTDNMTKFGFDSPEGVQALQFLVDLTKKHQVTPAQGMADPALVDQLFVQGLLGMRMGDASNVSTFRNQYPDFEFEVAFNPKGPANRAAFGNMGFLVISKASKNKELAWELVKYITSAKVTADYLPQVSLFPVRKDVSLYENDPVLSTFAGNGTNIVPYPIHPKLRQVHAEFVPAIQAAILGQKTPEQSLSDAGERIAGILSD